MIEAGIVSEIYTQNNRDNTFQPAIDISNLTVCLFLEKMERKGTSDFYQSSDNELVRIKEVINTFDHSLAQLPENMLLKDI